MTEEDVQAIELDPGTLLVGFIDSARAAEMLNRSRSTVTEMAGRRLLTAYRVGAVVLYWSLEVQRIADALEALRIKA